MAVLQVQSEAEMPKGFDAGLRAYVAWRHGWPATWERVATQTADTGELDISFAMPTGERDLWNVATREAHRGLGVYPPCWTRSSVPRRPKQNASGSRMHRRTAPPRQESTMQALLRSRRSPSRDRVRQRCARELRIGAARPMISELTSTKRPEQCRTGTLNGRPPYAPRRRARDICTGPRRCS
jgi:hypothetical protein